MQAPCCIIVFCEVQQPRSCRQDQDAGAALEQARAQAAAAAARAAGAEAARDRADAERAAAEAARREADLALQVPVLPIDRSARQHVTVLLG